MCLCVDAMGTVKLFWQTDFIGSLNQAVPVEMSAESEVLLHSWIQFHIASTVRLS